MTHNDKDDFHELPTVVVRPTKLVPKTSTGLTEAQKNRIIDGSLAAASISLEVVKTAMEIWKIRENSHATVAQIHAETDRLRVQLQGELEKMRETRAHLRERGAVVAELLRAAPTVLAALAETDRVRFIEQLPGIIEATLKHHR